MWCWCRPFYLVTVQGWCRLWSKPVKKVAVLWQRLPSSCDHCLTHYSGPCICLKHTPSNSEKLWHYLSINFFFFFKYSQPPLETPVFHCPLPASFQGHNSLVICTVHNFLPFPPFSYHDFSPQYRSIGQGWAQPTKMCILHSRSKVGKTILPIEKKTKY